MPDGHLEDRAALRALVDTYATAADTRDDDLFVSLFTPSATLTINQEGAVLGTYSGPDGLRAATAPLDEYHATMHLVANHTCVIAGDSADGITYCLANHLRPVDGGFENLMMVIRYDDRYARADVDDWRFDSRELQILWTESRPASIERLRF
jgi:hypothetical protein